MYKSLTEVEFQKIFKDSKFHSNRREKKMLIGWLDLGILSKEES